MIGRLHAVVLDCPDPRALAEFCSAVTGWQTDPQQFHIDFHVDDLDEGERQVLALGAKALETPPDVKTYRVYADPASRPLYLCIN